MTPRQYSDTSTAPVSGSVAMSFTCPTPAQIGPAAVVLVAAIVLVPAIEPAPLVALLAEAAPGAVVSGLAIGFAPPPPQADSCATISTAAMDACKYEIILCTVVP
jgi:hypothetical protein